MIAARHRKQLLNLNFMMMDGELCSDHTYLEQDGGSYYDFLIELRTEEMNLTPKEAHNSNPVIRGSTHTVWQLLLRIAHQTNPPTRKFQVSRREIQKATGIGSLNTIDNALENLESFGLLRRYSVPGSNDGYIYELLSLKESPVPKINKWSIATTLRQLADGLENNTAPLTPQQISKWSKLTYQARRLMPDLKL